MSYEGFRNERAPIGWSPDNSITVAASEISLSRSSNPTVINVPLSTDIATDMSGPEVEIDDSGVVSTLRISSMFTVSGEPCSSKSSASAIRCG